MNLSLLLETSQLCKADGFLLRKPLLKVHLGLLIGKGLLLQPLLIFNLLLLLNDSNFFQPDLLFNDLFVPFLLDLYGSFLVFEELLRKLEFNPLLAQMLFFGLCNSLQPGELCVLFCFLQGFLPLCLGSLFRGVVKMRHGCTDCRLLIVLAMASSTYHDHRFFVGDINNGLNGPTHIFNVAFVLLDHQVHDLEVGVAYFQVRLQELVKLLDDHPRIFLKDRVWGE